jgi:adenylate kinase
MALNVIMLGPPGAGKGTQAARFASARGIPKISTGDMLRGAVKAGTEIGLRVKAIMDRGELVSDDVMIGIVQDRLNCADAAGGFVLDGFPRTVPQAIALDRLIAGRDPLLIVDIAVPDAELVRRLASRRICEDCGTNADAGDAAQTEPQRCQRCGGRLRQRPDDREEVVRQRLEVYRRATEPLIEFYRKRPSFRTIDGAQVAEKVAAELMSAIASAGSGGMNPGTIGR